MVFNGDANGDDLYSDCRYLCGLDETSDTTTYTTKQFARAANRGLDRVTFLVFKADGQWNYDDSNNTGELFDTTTNLVNGTEKYAIPVSWLEIERVRAKDSSGSFQTLLPTSRRLQTDTQLTAPASEPQQYYIIGNFLYLDKAPNYDSTGGLEVQFKRGPSYFLFSDTTKTPGFASVFHRLISLYGAQDYCQLNYLPERAAAVIGRIGSPPDLANRQPGSGMEKELVDFYTRRDADKKVSIRPQSEDYGERGLEPGAGSYPTNLSARGW